MKKLILTILILAGLTIGISMDSARFDWSLGEPVITEDIFSKHEVDEEAFTKLFEATAKKKGYVKKEELEQQTYKQTTDSVLNDFLNSHPEYKPENDEGDVLWNRLHSKLSVYGVPKDPEAYKDLLNLSHGKVFPKKEIDRESIAASQNKINTASKSGGKPQVSAKPLKNAHLSPYLIGFSDEEKAEILK